MGTVYSVFEAIEDRNISSYVALSMAFQKFYRRTSGDIGICTIEVSKILFPVSNNDKENLQFHRLSRP